ncbi:MAG: hypothetical protein WED33_12815 [Bacteroidia bacterium]
MRILLLTIAFSLSSIVLSAQASRGFDFVEGYVHTLKGDTLKGQVCYVNTKTNERLDKIYYLDAANSKKRMGAEKLAGFGFEGKHFEYVEIGDGFGKIPMQRVVQGDINLYNAWFKTENSNTRSFEYEKAVFLKKKNKEDLFEVFERKFEKAMAGYFKGDEDIIELMKTNSWGINDLDKIVNAYNVKE